MMTMIMMKPKSQNESMSGGLEKQFNQLYKIMFFLSAWRAQRTHQIQGAPCTAQPPRTTNSAHPPQPKHIQGAQAHGPCRIHPPPAQGRGFSAKMRSPYTTKNVNSSPPAEAESIPIYTPATVGAVGLPVRAFAIVFAVNVELFNTNESVACLFTCSFEIAMCHIIHKSAFIIIKAS